MTTISAATVAPTLPAVDETVVDDRYRLLEVVAEGADAVLWRARDLRLRRHVSIMLFRAGAPGGRRLRDLWAVAQLSHPGLAAVYDGGTTAAGRCYLVTEHVLGATLADRLADGPLPHHEAAALGYELASALFVLHGRGIVHGHVAAANVLLPADTDRRCVLGDLCGVGAPSPEHRRGDAVGTASDIWSLGTVLRAMRGDEADRAWRELVDAATHDVPAARPDAATVAARLAVLARASPDRPAA